VSGFSGTSGDDSEQMTTAHLTIFLITNTFFWIVVVSVLSGQSERFSRFREQPFETKTRILAASLMDIAVTVLPILTVWAYHEEALTLHLLTLGLIALIVIMHKASGKGQKRPIFSDWLRPEGSNQHSSLYTIERVEPTTFSCTECTRSVAKKADEDEGPSDSKSTPK